MINNLKKERIKLKLSVRALSEEVGISFATISRLERGVGKPDEYSRMNIEEWLKTGKNQTRPARRESLKKRVDTLEKRLDKLETSDTLK